MGKFVRAGKALAIATLLSAPAIAQAPMSLTSLAECRLNYEQAETLFKPLKAIKTDDYSDDYADNAVYFYSTAGVKPFGIDPVEFSRDDYDGDDTTDHAFVSMLPGTYDAAKKAMLRGHRASACTKPEGLAGKRTCFIAQWQESGKYKHAINLKVQEQDGKLYLRCTYTD